MQHLKNEYERYVALGGIAIYDVWFKTYVTDRGENTRETFTVGTNVEFWYNPEQIKRSCRCSKCRSERWTDVDDDVQQLRLIHCVSCGNQFGSDDFPQIPQFKLASQI